MLSWNPISYTLLRYSFVTDEILEKCSTLFNNNYGIWSEDAPHHSNNVLKAGARVRMGVKRLRELILFNDRCFLITAEVHSSGNNQPQLIGHAFCTWANYNRLKGNAVWITQLVVSSSHRGRGIAGTLLSLAKNSVEDVAVTGLVSSHPYAIRALSNACNRINLDLKFIGDHAKDVIRACDIPYLSNIQLIGPIFNKQSSSTVNSNQQPVSLVNTDFFVDHKEVLAILKHLNEKWKLGSLLDGHEFVVVLPAVSVRHSRTSSSDSSAGT